MKQWLDILRKVRDYGSRSENRTGTDTLSIFGAHLVFEDTNMAFPAVTTKFLAFKQVMGELAAFLQGAENLDVFHDMGCSIWDANAAVSYWQPRGLGDVGRIYGAQWRAWRGIDAAGQPRLVDQLAMLLEALQRDPGSRRHLLTTWQPAELDQMCLPPCHLLSQVSVRQHQRLDMSVYMRSVDLFLGLPFDVASYAVLQALIAKHVGLVPGHLHFFLGDTHIYVDHLEAVETVLSRAPLAPPTLRLNPITSIFSFRPEDASLIDYQHLGKVTARMSV